MAVDLKISGLFSRKSLVLQDEYLIEVSHHSMSDRVRRIGYDRIEAVMVSLGVAWGSILLAGIFVGIGLLLAMAAMQGGVDRDAWAFFAVMFLAIGVPLMVRAVLLRSLRLRITRGERDYDYKALTTPRGMDKFIVKLETRIEACQQRAWKAIEGEGGG